MKNIFILYGASGSGKSTLLHFLKKKGFSIHTKDTTRPPRKTESGKETLELRFLDKLHRENYAVIYKQYGYLYGVRKDLLKKAGNSKKPHFIIVNDIAAIKRFKSLHPKTTLIYVHADPENIPERFKARDKLELKQRIKRIRGQYLDFIKNNTIFNHIVVNFWEIKYAEKQILSIIKLYHRSNQARKDLPLDMALGRINGVDVINKNV